MKLVYFFSIITTLFLSLWCCAKPKKLNKGNKAPNFTLQDESKKWRSLSEFKGKNVVLYFYPQDNTPGCTTQACSFRDREALYAKHDIVVLGINFNSPESHATFKEKYHLPFILLTDATGNVAKAYGARSRIPLLNRFFPKRITFLIDKEGNILKVLENIDVSTYADQVLKEFNISQE